MNDRFSVKETKPEGCPQIRKIHVGAIPFIPNESPEDLKHRIVAAINADEKKKKEEEANNEQAILKILADIISQHDGKGPCAQDFDPEDEDEDEDEMSSVTAEDILNKMQEIDNACDELCVMMTVLLRDGDAGDNFPALLDVYSSIKNIQNEMADNAVTVDILAE